MCFSSRESATLDSPKHQERLFRTSADWCGRFAGIGRAQLCFVVPIATGAPWQVIEFTSYLDPTTEFIMPGSRVRVPPFPPIKSA
jgi:hypothetical protein